MPFHVIAHCYFERNGGHHLTSQSCQQKYILMWTNLLKIVVLSDDCLLGMVSPIMSEPPQAKPDDDESASQNHQQDVTPTCGVVIL